MEIYKVKRESKSGMWNLQYFGIAEGGLNFQMKNLDPVYIGKRDEVEYHMIFAASQNDAFEIAFSTFGGRKLNIGDVVEHPQYGRGKVVAKVEERYVRIAYVEDKYEAFMLAYVDGLRITLLDRWNFVK